MLTFAGLDVDIKEVTFLRPKRVHGVALTLINNGLQDTDYPHTVLEILPYDRHFEAIIADATYAQYSYDRGIEAFFMYRDTRTQPFIEHTDAVNDTSEEEHQAEEVQDGYNGADEDEYETEDEYDGYDSYDEFEEWVPGAEEEVEEAVEKAVEDDTVNPDKDGYIVMPLGRSLENTGLFRGWAWDEDKAAAIQRTTNNVMVRELRALGGLEVLLYASAEDFQQARDSIFAAVKVAMDELRIQLEWIYFGESDAFLVQLADLVEDCDGVGHQACMQSFQRTKHSRKIRALTKGENRLVVRSSR